MGVVLLALINGSHSRKTALVSWDQQPDPLNDAVREPVDAFAQLTAAKRRSRRVRLDEYPSTQAKQRLGDSLERQKPPGRAMRLWVPEDQVDAAMRIVADEVVVQRHTSWRLATNALGAMTTSYDKVRPVLAKADLAHSDARSRARVQTVMAGLFQRAGT